MPKRHSCFEFSLCLSRACLGKIIVFNAKWHRKNGVFLSYLVVVNQPIAYDGVEAGALFQKHTVPGVHAAGVVVNSAVA